MAWKGFICRFFETKESRLSQEFWAGLTSFFSLAYIVQVHPFILSQAGVSFNACVTSTVLICFFSSLTMGIYAKNPLAMAPGLGINAFFVFNMVLGQGIPFEKALGAVFWSGILFLILSILKVRENIIHSVPNYLKRSMASGIGLMIAFSGFQQGGMITLSKETFVSVASLSFSNVLFIIGLLMAIFFIVKKIRGAFVLSILCVTVLAFLAGFTMPGPPLVEYKGWVSLPDFSLLGRLDILGSLSLSFFPVIFSLAFVDLFESLGTLMGLLGRFDLKDDQGKPRRLKESLISDALGTVYSALMGSSSATVYMESASGIREGGRTGLSAVVTACLFLPFLFLSPLLSMIPMPATAAVLVLVGVLMMEPAMHIQWGKIEEAWPSFMVMALIPFTFSITNGIVWGVLSCTVIQILKKKSLTVTWIIINIFCLFSLWIKP